MRRPRPARASLALLAALAVSGAGCSALGIRAPPANARPPLRCTTHRGGPVIDTVMAIALGLPGAVFVIDDAVTDHGEWDDVGLIIGTPPLIAGALYALSAWHGFSATGACLDLHARHRAD